MCRYHLFSLLIVITMTTPALSFADEAVRTSSQLSQDSQSRNNKFLADNSDQNNQRPNAQTQIAQAAEHFDAFALLMPRVLNAKLEAFMKHGFKAILLPDSETQPNEERMVDSLVKGLQALGNSLSEELPNNQSSKEAGQEQK